MQSHQKSVQNLQIESSLGVMDSINTTATYTLFLNEVMQKLLMETARFIVFPATAAFSILRATLAWRQAGLHRQSKSSLLMAIIETMSALAITIAVVGTFVAASIFATLAPLIFSALLASKALYHLGAATYYYSLSSENAEQDAARKKKAHNNLIGAFVLSLATIAVTSVMIFLKPMMAIFGIVAGLIGVALNINHLYKTYYTSYDNKTIQTHVDEPIISTETPLSQNALLQKKFGSKSQPPIITPEFGYTQYHFLKSNIKKNNKDFYQNRCLRNSQ